PSSPCPFSFLLSLILSLCRTFIHLFFISLSSLYPFSHSISLPHSIVSPSFNIYPLHSLFTAFIQSHSCSLFFPSFFLSSTLLSFLLSFFHSSFLSLLFFPSSTLLSFLSLFFLFFFPSSTLLSFLISIFFPSFTLLP